MSLENRREILDTIEEIFPLIEQIKVDNTDIKAISDVVLALEKITPDLQENLPDFLSEIPACLSKLFEKFLLEPVENTEAGLKLTSEGLLVVQEAIESGETAPFQDRAENALLKLNAGFKILSPAIADMVFSKDDVDKLGTTDTPEEQIISAADEVLSLLGLGTTPEPKAKRWDKQTEAEAIFSEALNSANKGETGEMPDKDKEEKEPAAAPETPSEPAGKKPLDQPPPISQTGRFNDIMNLLERGEQDEQKKKREEAEEEVREKAREDEESAKDEAEEGIEQIRAILEGKSTHDVFEKRQKSTEDILDEAKARSQKPRQMAQPSPEIQADAEAALREAHKKSEAPGMLLGPDGRRQMEAEAALEHARESSHEPKKPADWTPELERQKDADAVIDSAFNQISHPPTPAAPSHAAQDDVEALLQSARDSREESEELEVESVGQQDAEEILAEYIKKPEQEELEPVAPEPEALEPEVQEPVAQEPEEVFSAEETGAMEEEGEEEGELVEVSAEEEPAPAQRDDLTQEQREAEEIMALFASKSEPEAPEPEAPEPEVQEPEAQAPEPQEPQVPEPVEAFAKEKAAVAEWEETGMAEDDEMFAGLDDQQPQEPAEDIDEPPADPLFEKLSAIANEVTLMESQMDDKKAVSDVMLALEGIQVELSQREAPHNMVVVADVLAALYEKILLEGITDNKKALDLTVNGIMILSAYLENPSVVDSLAEQAKTLISALKESFEVEPLRTTFPVAPAGGKEEAISGAEVLPPAKDEIEQTKFLGYESVQMATSEDLLIYSEFVSEVTDAAAHIETDLLELETAPEDMDLINDLFRAFHSIKGAAGFLGVNTVNILCHEAETMLDKFRKKEMVSNPTSVDLLLKAIDLIKVVNDGLSDSCEKAKMNMPGAFLEIPRYDPNRLASALREARAPEGESPPVKAAPKVTKAAAVAPVVEEELAEVAEIAEEADEEQTYLGQILLDEGKVTKEDVELALQAQREKRPLGEILMEMGVVDQPSLEQALVDQVDRKKKMKSASLKIDTEKLDSLLEMVGELVISQSIVSQEAEFIMAERAGLFKNIQSLGKITKNIQDQVMTLRMVPLKQTFQKMSRLVRDLSKKMKKPVSFHVSGEETEIDKTIIEELNDPLVHLLRNAMDHGIEGAEERAARSKPTVGNIWLNAYHRGGNVYIEVIDDGRGVDKNKILKKALEKGLVDEDTELTDQEAHNLLMMPGFSTHDFATDISGRGVGMDVVRSNIDALGGRLEISSKQGEGSEFTVRLPLTMAIVDGMIVQIGGDRFVIPTISIRESIRPRREEISTYKNQGEMVDVRGKLLPLVRLRSFLGVNDGVAVNPWEGLVIIVESDEMEFGFMVDDLLGQQQVVIKSLDKRFKGLPGISGGTILGDGRVGLILDVGSVVEYK